MCDISFKGAVRDANLFVEGFQLPLHHQREKEAGLGKSLSRWLEEFCGPDQSGAKGYNISKNLLP